MKIIPSRLSQDRHSEYEELVGFTKYGVNLHPIWFTSYVEAYGYKNSDLLLEARDGNTGKLYGLLPLVRKDDQVSRFIKHRRLVPMGYQPTDFFDILSVEGAEFKVTKSIVDWLKTNNKLWDQIMIDLIPVESKSWQPFVAHLEDAGIKPDVSTNRFFLKLDTTKPYSEYLKSLGTEKQKEIRYYKNKLLKIGGKLEVEHITQGLAQYFDEFVKNYMERRSAKDQSDPFTRFPPLYNFTKEIVLKYEERNWIRLSVLKLDSKIIAYAYHFIYNHIVFYHMPTFLYEYRDYSPGKILLFALIQNAFEDPGIYEFNFMRSIENSYKAWFNPSHESYVTIIVNNPWSYRNKILPILSLLASTRNRLLHK